MDLKIYRLNSHGCQLIPAEKTLNGTANEGGNKWCHPYSTANKLGWWVTSPVDMDIQWDGNQFQYEILSEYPEEEAEWVRTIILPEDNVDADKWCPIEGGRTKFSFGIVEPAVLQIWTGLIFKTPPGWGLHIRSPINCDRRPYRVMEGILETDWMQYDIWINLVFESQEKVEIRRDAFPPLAQLIPVHRSTYDAWQANEIPLDRNTAEGNQVLDFWLQYNQQKFGNGGDQLAGEGVYKDSTTFWRNRKRILGDDGLPKPEELKPKCPFLAGQKMIFKTKNPGGLLPGFESNP